MLTVTWYRLYLLAYKQAAILSLIFIINVVHMVSLNNKHYDDDCTHCGANVASLYEDFLTVVYPFSSKENPECFTVRKIGTSTTTKTP